MKTMKLLIEMLVIVLCASVAWAQTDPPSSIYGQEVDIQFPEGESHQGPFAWLYPDACAVSKDGLMYAQTAATPAGIFVGYMPDMNVSRIFELDDVHFDYPTGPMILNIAIHPDKTRLLYVTHIYNEDYGGIYIHQDDTITRGNGLRTICMLNIQTGEHEVLIEGGLLPEWSPDGRYILYMVEDYRKYTIGFQAAENDGRWALYDTITGESTFISDLIGTEPQDITFSYADLDNDFYYLSRESYPQLYKAAFNGSAITQVSNFSYNDILGWSIDGMLYGVAISNDEEWAVISSYGTGGFYLMMYDIATGRVFSLLTGEELSNDLHEMVEYHEAGYLEDTQNVTQFLSWCADGNTLALKVYEYLDGDEGLLYGLYYKSFDPVFYKGNPTVVESGVPDAFATLANFPNPFNPQTTLSFNLPEGGYTSLAIYNLAGQKVRELVAGELTPGSHEVVWDGRDESGMPVSSGVFVSQLKTGDTVVTNRMTLVK